MFMRKNSVLFKLIIMFRNNIRRNRLLLLIDWYYFNIEIRIAFLKITLMSIGHNGCDESKRIA